MHRPESVGTWQGCEARRWPDISGVCRTVSSPLWTDSRLPSGAGLCGRPRYATRHSPGRNVCERGPPQSHPDACLSDVLRWLSIGPCQRSTGGPRNRPHPVAARHEADHPPRCSGASGAPDAKVARLIPEQTDQGLSAADVGLGHREAKLLQDSRRQIIVRLVEGHPEDVAADLLVLHPQLDTPVAAIDHNPLIAFVVNDSLGVCRRRTTAVLTGPPPDLRPDKFLH